jgi:hypothetical protein
MAQTAQDTFVAQMPDGSSVFVQKGSTWADKHAVVALDKGSGRLFKPLDLGEDEKPPPKSAAKADPAKAEVKPDPPRAAAVKADPPKAAGGKS